MSNPTAPLVWVFASERRDKAHLFDPSRGYSYGLTLCGLHSAWMWLKQNERQGADLPQCADCLAKQQAPK